MNIEMVKADAVVSRRHGGKKGGARYVNYRNAIQKHLDWFFEQIDASTDGMIRVKLADLAHECGMKMRKVIDGKAIEKPGELNHVSVGFGFKYVLFHAGIWSSMGKVKDGQPVLIMRRKAEGDELPASLQDKNGETGAKVVEMEDSGSGKETDVGKETDTT